MYQKSFPQSARSALRYLLSEVSSVYMEIQPNAFATELSRMITAKIGQRYWIIKRKTLFPVKRSSAVLPLLLQSFANTDDSGNQNDRLQMAAIGIMTEFVRKSKKSRNCMPMIFTNASGPYPREERLPRTTMMMPTIIPLHLFYGSISSSSSKVDTALSVRAMELVRAANSTSRKNRIPTMAFQIPCWQIPWEW